MDIKWAPYKLIFNFEAKTSRETLSEKETWFVKLYDDVTHNISVGEAAFFPGLSGESREEFIDELNRISRENDLGSKLSSVRFGIETAMRNLLPMVDNAFTRGEAGIPINGLIWMDDKESMQKKIDEKLAQGYRIIKLKIGGIDFDEELELVKELRKRYPVSDLEIRLDANGSFRTKENALKKLQRLAQFDIHSLEQPIPAGQIEDMAEVCRKSPVRIALDEELIGFRTMEEKEQLLDAINPDFLILKPSLCGGFSGANEWIELARQRRIGWWGTSALESNVGLQAIALWLYSHNVDVPQGLGTGLLYKNNIPSPLELRGDRLFFNPEKHLELIPLEWQG